MTVLDSDLVSAYLRRDAAARFPALHEFVTSLLTVDGLAISFVTQFEVRRGLEELLRKGEGRRKLVNYEKLLERVDVLGLDSGSGEGWNLAARLWAVGRVHKPAIVLADADLLIAATAEYHGRPLATCDSALAENLRTIGFRNPVRVVPQS